MNIDQRHGLWFWAYSHAVFAGGWLYVFFFDGSAPLLVLAREQRDRVPFGIAKRSSTRMGVVHRGVAVPGRRRRHDGAAGRRLFGARPLLVAAAARPDSPASAPSGG